MKFANPQSSYFVPNNAQPAEAALARATHLCIAAHQDDVELMAYDGIAECYGQTDRRFAAVVVTNGAGSSRTGLYAHLTDEEMQQVRREEQNRAAMVGDYGICIQLAHPSSAVKASGNPNVRADLAKIVAGCRPHTVYLHNPADKHDTHIAVLLRTLEALRALPAEARPARVLGCEVWRNLDWLSDNEKQALDVSARPNLANALMCVFDSQISGGKRYDLAAIGRRTANATFHTSHASDKSNALNFAIDLTPLVTDPQLSIEEFTIGAIDRFRSDVQQRLRQFR